eukprot:Gregarina_sp_Poly_1__9766@NODE_622_length_7094_cov_92_849580_g477_i0_p8_GENE_NODE_622_length_7094_cov_92_849580_g477_i0NODE_622_length_7094_cov_92_849580_g477_i0_p8_ORF_typecomplete_len142_score5_37_NODE_622_length_7094_cov_92_849580_g477_i065386963
MWPLARWVVLPVGGIVVGGHLPTLLTIGWTSLRLLRNTFSFVRSIILLRDYASHMLPPRTILLQSITTPPSATIPPSPRQFNVCDDELGESSSWVTSFADVSLNGDETAQLDAYMDEPTNPASQLALHALYWPSKLFRWRR